MQILNQVIVFVGINSCVSFVTTFIPIYFGTHCTRLTHLLSYIWYTIPSSNNFKASCVTTSFINGFSLSICFSLSLYPSYMYIFCIQRAGLIPLISNIRNPNAAFLFLRIKNVVSTWSSYSAQNKITCKFHHYPKMHT